MGRKQEIIELCPKEPTHPSPSPSFTLLFIHMDGALLWAPGKRESQAQPDLRELMSGLGPRTAEGQVSQSVNKTISESDK